MPIHDRFDLQYYIAQCSLERLRAQARQFVLKRRDEMPKEYPDEAAVDRHIRLMEPSGEILVGPEDLAVNQQLRAEAFADKRYAGARIPADVFIWQRGESPHPAMTKIGGIPYRPRSSAWPHDGAGKPVRFVAQLCFADSRDISGDLPGDVLLIFGDDDALLAEPERLVFEWSSLGIPEPVFEVPQMAADEPLTPYHGLIHRTEDWPDLTDEIPAGYRCPWLLGVFEGTKIGGLPRFIQDEPTPVGRFLAALGSVSATSSTAQFLNTLQPGSSSSSDLMIGDMGSLYLFLDRHGRVRAESH
jgi:hypothetical protein